MNMQKLMQQAQQMQAQLMKDQKELEKTEYVGSSSFVSVKINGKHEVLEVKIDLPEGETIEANDKEMLEDMFMVAMNEAIGKLNQDKENKMGKYGQGLAGLM